MPLLRQPGQVRLFFHSAPHQLAPVVFHSINQRLLGQLEPLPGLHHHLSIYDDCVHVAAAAAVQSVVQN